jgi:hypothetical protein
MGPDPMNPHALPPSSADTCAPSRRPRQARRNGPACYIVLFAFIGGIAGMPFLAQKNAIGFLGVVIGALLGGFVYRMGLLAWPIDPTAKKRRFGYALAVVVLLPGLIGSVAGLQAQGLGMTLIGLIVGLALAGGILVSGDRRFVPPADSADDSPR